jgi:two-component system response regulator PilR (NtrC family)
MRQVKERIARGAQHGAGAGARRVRHRQGTGGARHPRLQPPRRRPLRRGQLQRHPRDVAGGRVLRRRKGSYTGATADREGYFQAARGGTLFLDEIGDLPLPMQSKLLRAIQERQVRALGSTQEDAVDVRIVSATHRDLAADVQAGRFRQDLFYRLNVIEILVPPLRERREDLPRCARRCWRASRRKPACRRRRCRPTCWSSCRRIRCPATCASWRTCCTARWRCPTAGAAGRRAACAVPAAQPMTAAVEAASPVRAGRAATCRPTSTSRSARSWCAALQETGFNRTAAAQRLGLSLRQIRYRIARLAIATPGGDEPDDAQRA